MLTLCVRASGYIGHTSSLVEGYAGYTYFILAQPGKRIIHGRGCLINADALCLYTGSCLISHFDGYLADYGLKIRKLRLKCDGIATLAKSHYGTVPGSFTRHDIGAEDHGKCNLARPSVAIPILDLQ